VFPAAPTAATGRHRRSGRAAGHHVGMTAAARHPLGASLLREVDDVVAAARARGARRLDIPLVAARLSVEIVERDLGEHLLGLTLDNRRMLLHSDRRRLRGAQRLLVFAHELAHVLRRRGHFPQVSDRDEEWFADWFARELVLPRVAARRAWSEAELAAWHVDYDTVALQLAALGAVPQVIRNGHRVLCGLCGTPATAGPASAGSGACGVKKYVTGSLTCAVSYCASSRWAATSSSGSTASPSAQSGSWVAVPSRRKRRRIRGARPETR
jgi:hypothetical protein